MSGTGKTILVLGGGVGGIVAANDLRRRLPARHEIVLVNREETFVFAPSLLWLLVGARRPEQISRPLRRLVRRGVSVTTGEVERIDADRREVLVGGRTLTADFIVIALVVLSALPVFGAVGSRTDADADSPRSVPALADSLAAGQLIQPEDLARLLANSTARQPAVLQVGFKVLFRSGHIPGSRYIGPASKPEGLAALKRALRKIPREQAIVLYCGCCPWADCPNVGPALHAAQELRSGNVRVLYIAKNLQHDWVEKGLPVSKGDQ